MRSREYPPTEYLPEPYPCQTYQHPADGRGIPPLAATKGWHLPTVQFPRHRVIADKAGGPEFLNHGCQGSGAHVSGNHVRQCTGSSTPPARTSNCGRRIALGGGMISHCRLDRPQRAPRDTTARQGAGSIGQSSCEHSSQPFASRATSSESPCSIADLILRQRSQSFFSIISAAPSWARHLPIAPVYGERRRRPVSFLCYWLDRVVVRQFNQANPHRHHVVEPLRRPTRGLNRFHRQKNGSGGDS
jgi:hypothetical protein